MEASESEIAEGCAWALLFAVVGLVWRGFVLSILWAWFLVPIGAPPIGMANSLGIATIVSMLLPAQSLHAADEKSQTFQGAVLSFGTEVLVRPAIFLAVGYLLHMFM